MYQNKQISFSEKITIPYKKFKKIGKVSTILIILGLIVNIINYLIFDNVVLLIISVIFISISTFIFIYTYFMGPNNIIKLIKKNKTDIDNAQTILTNIISFTLKLQKANDENIQNILKIFTYSYPLIKPFLADNYNKDIQKLDIIIKEFSKFVNNKVINISKVEKAIIESDFEVLKEYSDEILFLYNNIKKKLVNNNNDNYSLGADSAVEKNKTAKR